MLVWRRHGVPLLLAGRFTETGTLGFVSRPLWQDEHRAVGFFVNFSFLDSDICLQDNLILGNFSDLYIFHLEIIFFVLSQEKNSNNCWFLAPCVMKGRISLAALWIARRMVGVCWTRSLNILLCYSHGLLLRIKSEKNMNVVCPFSK